MKAAFRFIHGLTASLGNRKANDALVVNNNYYVTHVHCKPEECPYHDVEGDADPDESSDD